MAQRLARAEATAALTAAHARALALDELRRMLPVAVRGHLLP
jgi:hypothetical protein